MPDTPNTEELIARISTRGETYTEAEVLAALEAQAAELARLRAERDAAAAESALWRGLYRRAINQANGLTNYVEDRPELRRAERELSAIETAARQLDASPPPPAQPAPPSAVERDAVRLDWLMRHVPGRALRPLIGVMAWSGDIDEFRAAIDAAAGKGEAS